MPELIGLDFETYSAVDLKKHGLARYINDPSFKVLIGAVVRGPLAPSGGHSHLRFNFIDDPIGESERLRAAIAGAQIAAHNAAFEQAVLNHLRIDFPSSRFVDSAVVARAAGAGSKLEVAAPQLLSTDKLDAGQKLVRLFCTPGKLQASSDKFDRQIVIDHPTDWDDFTVYCTTDAELSLRIAADYLTKLTPQELAYQAVTIDMNNVGWCVDVKLVKEMQRRYMANQQQALHNFQVRHNAADLNLNSLKQLKEWCAARGIKATSFDKKHVAKLLARLDLKLNSPSLNRGQVQNYSEVYDMLSTKQILGGSSLKKLQVILDTAAPDTWNPGTHRLKDQYVHCGAGQSLRTTGRAVQMQNLKRLGVDVADMDELDDPDCEWDNTQLSDNLRQVFTASDPNGRLIVGDFKSVESRGLAWLADEKWKLGTFKHGDDLYKVLAAKIFGTQYDTVTKEQRQVGKVGELSCGYGAGPDAVVAFAENMGVKLELGEATKLVYDWRDANPQITAMWNQLNNMLHEAVQMGKRVRWELSDGMVLVIGPTPTPQSLLDLNGGVQSITMEVHNDRSSEVILKRYFHGCHVRGRNVCYYRPSDLKSGDLWRRTFIDPKTKQRRNFELYGGKLAGILTQSFCRELFFESLLRVHHWYQQNQASQVKLVGQFHDEIVLDWKPGGVILAETEARLKQMMSDSAIAPSFPLAAEVKSAYRYTK